MNNFGEKNRKKQPEITTEERGTAKITGGNTEEENNQKTES